MKKSQITKKYDILAFLFSTLSFIATLLPLFIGIVMSYASIDVVATKKVVLTLMIVAAVVLTVVNFLMKLHLRSILWLLLIGVYVCLNNITAIIIIVAIATVLDEFVFMPLYKYYKDKARASAVVDEHKGE